MTPQYEKAPFDVEPAAPGLHQIVIVGGGAGGLELATRLGDTLGKSGKAAISLIEKSRTHFWKPHLHEIAAGSMDLGTYELNHLAQSYWHGYRYRFGEVVAIDRSKRKIITAPCIDEHGEEIISARTFHYDTLVMSIGSLTNDFGVPGVKEHAIALETPQQAVRFHRRLVNACIRAHAQQAPLRDGQLTVAIIGAGATGVELAAELHNSTRTLISYGLDRIDPGKDIRIVLVEAAPRILPTALERISAAAARLLGSIGVEVKTRATVAEVMPEGLRLSSGEIIPSELVVWAAGVKAPEMLKHFGGLESNAINQLIVRPTLQTTLDENIFALGDCAACQWQGKEAGTLVPPRAQAAHQQANHMYKQIRARLRGQPLGAWQYRDFGSLVSLGKYSTVGNLMGGRGGGNIWVEGVVARLVYASLYKMHELALHGWTKVTLDALARLITRRTEPHVKLH